MGEGRLLVIGAGGHGRVAADCARAMQRWSQIAFLDSSWPERQTNGCWQVIGRDCDATTMARLGDEIFVAIGGARSRLSWVRRIAEAGLRIATIRHPATIVSAEVEIGAGSLVVAGAIVNYGTRIGSACIINTGATVDHDCNIADGVHVCPGAHLAGDVTVGAESWIGIGASVRQGITIGSGVSVGAGAAVVRDLADGVTAVGVPARPILR